MTGAAPSARDALTQIAQWAAANRLDMRQSPLTGSGCVLSFCLHYRYLIWRVWDAQRPLIGFGMLNPSRADHDVDDPTAIRCSHRALDLGYGGWIGWNLNALRATDPKVMKLHVDPVGKWNDAAIDLVVPLCAMTIAAWGVDGRFNGRDLAVLARLGAAGVRLHHLGLTKDQFPRHPLYVARSMKPMLWEYGA